MTLRRRGRLCISRFCGSSWWRQCKEIFVICLNKLTLYWSNSWGNLMDDLVKPGVKPHLCALSRQIWNLKPNQTITEDGFTNYDTLPVAHNDYTYTQSSSAQASDVFSSALNLHHKVYIGVKLSNQFHLQFTVTALFRLFIENQSGNSILPDGLVKYSKPLTADSAPRTALIGRCFVVRPSHRRIVSCRTTSDVPSELTQTNINKRLWTVRRNS